MTSRVNRILIQKGPRLVTYAMTALRFTTVTVTVLSTPLCYSYLTYKTDKTLRDLGRAEECSSNYSESGTFTDILHASWKLWSLLEYISSQKEQQQKPIDDLPEDKLALLDKLTVTKEIEKETGIYQGYRLYRNIIAVQLVNLGMCAATLFFTGVYAKRIYAVVPSIGGSLQSGNQSKLGSLIALGSKSSKTKISTGTEHLIFSSILPEDKLDDLLERFRRDVSLDFEKFSGTSRVRIDNLEKHDGHILGNLCSVTKPSSGHLFDKFRKRELFYIDMDLLRDEYPAFWYMFHSCVPWSLKGTSDHNKE